MQHCYTLVRCVLAQRAVVQQRLCAHYTPVLVLTRCYNMLRVLTSQHLM
jgi:hypothetical protein